MRSLNRRRATTAALALTFAALGAVPALAADTETEHDDSYSFAVIGDTPYGAAQLTAFPKVIAQINADSSVKFTAHVGDIKSGSTACSDDYFAQVEADFETFAKPLIYTPGDNEWTDCHRVNNGAYDPLERLSTLRSIFFASPGRTLGAAAMPVASQAKAGFPENVRFARAGVQFATVHIVGSNNGLAPWTGKTAATTAQANEVSVRTAADLAHLKETFATAKKTHSRAVVLFTQADMFDNTWTPATPAIKDANFAAFTPIVRAIAQESAAFGKPVYLVNGDSHVYTQDQPLAAGSAWATYYGVSTPAANLTRVTIDGAASVNNWLKVSIGDHAALSFTRVNYLP